MMFKMAYCGIPHIGGTHTVYRILREGLARHDIELRWVGLTNSGNKLSDEFKDEMDFGELIYLEAEANNLASPFIEHLSSNYQGIFFNVLADNLQTNAARYIPNHILKLQIVHTITPATYRAARSIRDHVHGTIGVSPRIATDLIRKMRFSATKVHTIPNAVNISAFQEVGSKRITGEPLKLLYLGRVEETAKGILWLPDILQACLQLDIDFSMTVAGGGPDLAKLKLKISKMGLEKFTNFYGAVNYADVPKLFAQHHVFVMPSRYEGFGYSLVEAMASGCVPVCSRITGVTDFIVSHGENGYLFSVGDTKQAALFINKLKDENVRQRFSINAKAASQSRFSVKQQAQSYANLIQDLRENPPQITSPLSVDNWYLASGLKPSLSVYLPEPVKNVLRVWRERLAAGSASK